MGCEGFPNHPFPVITLMVCQVKTDFMFSVLNGSLDPCTLVNVSFDLFSVTKPCLKLFQPCFDEVADLAIKLLRHRDINLAGSGPLLCKGGLHQPVTLEECSKGFGNVRCRGCLVCCFGIRMEGFG